MFLLFFYLTLAILVSFLCSVMEAVLLSTPISFLRAKEDSGNKIVSIFIKFKNNIDRPLSAILSLNTVAHTIGAAGVGAQATKIFGEVYFGLISAILTIMILFFSEIIPKTIGAKYWRSLALVSGVIIQTMVYITYPLVVMSELVTKLFVNNKKEKTVSREEISAIADIGIQEGILDEKENAIIQNLIKLKQVKIGEIMTPRVVAVTASEEMTLNDFMKNKDFLPFSRIPVFLDKMDHITGYVFRQEVFEKLAEDTKDLKLKDIKRNIVIVQSLQQVLAVWEILLQEKEHIALVIDEYGGMDGLVTMEDIIEAILGLEIVDEKDKIIDLKSYARKRWEERKAKYKFIE